MRVQTFSILTGGTACNARCPFCVSKMTPKQGVDQKLTEVNWDNLEIGCLFAKDCGVSTVLLTGKGEPTLFPDRVTEFLEHIREFRFPFVEMQTNGIAIFQQREAYAEHLKRWHRLRLRKIAVSIVHYDNQKNRENYQPNGQYMDLVGLIAYLHEHGFSVRLSCIMSKGNIDKELEVVDLIHFAKANKVEQLTITPVRKPEKSESPGVAKWVEGHELDDITLGRIKHLLDYEGHKLLTLAHGAVVYDVIGQNVCLSDCLTENKSPEEIRQLIFFPDGHLRYDWQHPGAILL